MCWNSGVPAAHSRVPCHSSHTGSELVFLCSLGCSSVLVDQRLHVLFVMEIQTRAVHIWASQAIRQVPGPSHPAGPRQRGEPGRVAWLVPRRVGMPSQHRVLAPEDQQLSIRRLIPAEHQHSQAE